MSLTLEALQIIDTIARRGSFASAAAALGKVPSALTYTVRKLEGDLDVLLFDRRGNRARLTPAGQELLEQGRELLKAADDLACRVKGVASGWEVELRIAADATIAFERILPLIEDFHRLQAPTGIRISYEVLDGAWDALLAGRADLVIGAPHDAPAEAFDSGRFSMRPLGEVEFQFCVAPHHALAGASEPLEPEQLLAHRAVAVANSARSLPARSTGLLSGQALLTVGTLQQKVAAQVAGLGVGYVPSAFAQPHVAAGRLIVKKVAEPAPVAVLRYAWRSAGQGKALRWWLDRLAVARVRKQLLKGP